MTSSFNWNKHSYDLRITAKDIFPEPLMTTNQFLMTLGHIRVAWLLIIFLQHSRPFYIVGRSPSCFSYYLFVYLYKLITLLLLFLISITKGLWARKSKEVPTIYLLFWSGLNCFYVDLYLGAIESRWVGSVLDSKWMSFCWLALDVIE